MRREFGTLGLILAIGLAATLKEHRFLQPESLSSILLWIPLLAVVGFGQMFVIVTKGIDVSVGSVAGFAAIVMGMVFKAHPEMSLWLGSLVAIAAGLLLGCINGALISWARIPPIIATLGGLSAYRGLIFIVSKGKQVDSNYLPDALTNLSQKGPITVSGITIPWILVITLVIALLLSCMSKFTHFGRDIFAIGGNPNAARLRGIPVEGRLFLVYALTGALAGLAGLIYTSKFGFVNPGSAGSGLELSVIAAVVIGGTKVSGGSGTVWGVLLGALLLGMLNVALSVLGIPEDYQQFVYGVIILIALLLDTGFHRLVTMRSGARA